MEKNSRMISRSSVTANWSSAALGAQSLVEGQDKKFVGWP